MAKINVTIFKPSGKWYTDEDMEVPNDIVDYNMPEFVEKNARIRNMTYLFHGIEYEVPYLVHVGD